MDLLTVLKGVYALLHRGSSLQVSGQYPVPQHITLVKDVEVSTLLLQTASFQG